MQGDKPTATSKGKSVLHLLALPSSPLLPPYSSLPSTPFLASLGHWPSATPPHDPLLRSSALRPLYATP